MYEASTIAAIATAPGRSGVAIIRVSGPDAFLIAEKLTKKKPQKGRVSFVKFFDVKDASLIDSGLLLSFKGPNSYTGEDVVEFQCHGGFVTPNRILNACFSAGARLSRRGEFTERAFLNGRLTLDQAQAVLDLIDARTTRAASKASSILNGSETGNSSDKKLHILYNEILDVSSTLEHALDINEDELPDEFFVNLLSALRSSEISLNNTLRNFKERRLLREGISVVLAGPPNVGKSSLLNTLLQENRAIVSDIPGTTRDTIEEWLDLDGWPVRLIDTAGLRKTDDIIEAEGVRRTEALVEKANIVLRLTTNIDEAKLSPRKENEIVILTKCDLVNVDDYKDCLAISVKTGAGLISLKSAIISRLSKLADSAEDFSSEGEDERAEKISSLLRASKFLSEADKFLSSLQNKDLVLAGNAIQRACEILSSLLGTTYSEDLLTKIFSHFCVGK